MDDLPEEKEKKHDSQPSSSSGASRRDFLKISGVSAALPLVAKASALAEAPAAQP